MREEKMTFLIKCDHLKYIVRTTLRMGCDHTYFANPKMNLLKRPNGCHGEGKLSHCLRSYTRLDQTKHRPHLSCVLSINIRQTTVLQKLHLRKTKNIFTTLKPWGIILHQDSNIFINFWNFSSFKNSISTYFM